jgi:hypothetical protein
MATTTIDAPRGEQRSGRPIAHTSAVAWINGRQAHVARLDDERTVTTLAIERGLRDEQAYLADVVDAMGDRERVMILGPGSARLALEREYVAIHRRPDRLVDVEPDGPVTDNELVDLVRRLAG